MTIADANTVIDAFERCFCRDTSKCDGCYQEGPGFGFACVRMLEGTEKRDQYKGWWG